MDHSLSQYLVVGLGGFGSSVIERVKALPIERNVVYHPLEVEGGKPVAEAYLPYRERLLGVLNREIFNFANTPLTVYLVGLLVEEHVASNLMHLGYLFKSLFRENIILSPRVKVLTAFPTIVPENAYAWLPSTQKVLAEIDGYATLREPFQPRYPDLKRSLPSISGPPFEDVVFCYCESLDEDDMEVSAQAAATKIYFDLVLLPERMSASEAVTEFYRSFPVGQGFAPISGTALSFLPSIQQMVRDEMEYLLMIRLCEKFFPAGPPAPGKPGKVAELVEPLLAKAHAAKLTQFLQEVVRHSLENERWFDLAAIDVLAKYDIEMSAPPDAYLQRFLSQLDHERSRFAGRVRDLTLEMILQVPDRIRDALTASASGLDLAEIDSLFTQAFFRVQQLLDHRSGTAQQLTSDWKRIRSDIESKVTELKQIVSDRGAKLKKGSDTEARVKGVFSKISVREILEKAIALSAVEGLAGEANLESRLRESYDRIHHTFADLLKKRPALLAHLHQRRDAYLRRRELYLYVFNQVFRQRLLDKEIERKIEEIRKTASEDSLSKVMESFFFKKWLPDPALSFEEAEKGLMEAIRLEARPAIEKVVSEMKVDYREVVRILQDIADAQVNSIFDMKYKEHPQAAYRQAMFLCHKDETLASSLGTTRKRDGIDLSDVFVVKNLPFQALQLMELYNLPFRALRQYASLDRHESPES
ncbi:MAG TPA: hypothetical protein VJH87_15025 [Vicinamibacteria bacterium]|nr:hypothetical protein [Vicinamibacteria bacterium]